jgi:hypothetical protein
MDNEQILAAFEKWSLEQKNANQSATWIKFHTHCVGLVGTREDVREMVELLISALKQRRDANGEDYAVEEGTPGRQ